MSRHISLSGQMEDFDRRREDLNLAQQVERETEERLSAALNAAHAAFKELERQNGHVKTRADLQEARIRELVAALQPFALEADLWAETTADDYKPVFVGNHMHGRAKFSVGDLRRARKCVPRTSL